MMEIVKKDYHVLEFCKRVGIELTAAYQAKHWHIGSYIIGLEAIFEVNSLM